MTDEQFRQGANDWRWFKPLMAVLTLMVAAMGFLLAYREYQAGKEDKRDTAIQKSIDAVKQEVADVNATMTDVRLTVARIESSRFKAEDGTRVWEAIAELRRDVAVIKSNKENRK